MINNKTAEAIVSISFAITIIISIIGWLGIKKSKKKYIVLWSAIIPLLISSIFTFFTNSYNQSILLLVVILSSYLLYISFLIVNTYLFLKFKSSNNNIDNDAIDKTIDLITNL